LQAANGPLGGKAPGRTVGVTVADAHNLERPKAV
jgi:hypothetical protein